ncbi:MAG: helix-turn-helix transcriptional regulator [Eubacterium sp.]|nr:helix-turn-helix transcriptional regulator [Eubacterium sp.]
MMQHENNQTINQVIGEYSSCMSGRLRRYRVKRLGKSQLEFGEQCHLSQRMISYIENTQMFSHFGMVHLILIAYGIGVFPSDILRRVEMELLDKNPKLMRRFFRNRKVYEKTRKRWTGQLEAIPAKLLEALYQIIGLLKSKNITEMEDEDLDPIRNLLGKH